MATKTTQVTRLPNAQCIACGGMGSIHLTAHFVNSNQEFEAPCWECYGRNVQLSLPTPAPTEN